MAPKTIPKGAIYQEKVFYTREWTPAVDRKFIEVLVEQRANGNFQVGRVVNAHAIMVAMGEVNKQFDTNFDYRFCVDRTKKLSKRYKVFNWIVHLSGVCFNPTSNKIECDQGLWEFICKEEKLGMAYMLQGEREFESLRYLFEEDNDSIGANDLVDIIEISSDIEGGDGDNGGIDVNMEPSQYILISEDNTDNSFWNELAWYASDSGNDASLVEINQTSVLSSTEKVKTEVKKYKRGISKNRYPSVEPPSSTASNSPLKKA